MTGPNDANYRLIPPTQKCPDYFIKFLVAFRQVDAVACQDGSQMGTQFSEIV